MNPPGTVPLYSPSRPPLAQPEETLWIGFPAAINYFASWFFGTIFVAIGGLLAMGGAIPYGLAAAGLGVLIMLQAMLSKLRRRYTVTSRKVMIEIGLFIKSSDEVRIKDIRSIFVRKAAVPGLFGVGSVELSSAARDKAEITFAGIAGANRVADLIRDLQES